MTEADDADVQAIHANTSTQAECLLHVLDPGSGGITI